jgi:hypothetical protein
MTTPRLPQPRLGTNLLTVQKAAAYDPAVPSDGLTLDTSAGPVDLVAVERALLGQLTPLTSADVTHALDRVPTGEQRHTAPAAAGLGVSIDAVKRAVHRRNARHADRTRA